MQAYPQRRELVLVHYRHIGCHGYMPVAPYCEELRAEQLPWVPIDTGVDMAQARHIQQRLGDRVQELIIARAKVCHATCPVVLGNQRAVAGPSSQMLCCDLRGIYVRWGEGGDRHPGPNLLAEELQGFADQLALIRRRGFIDCLVIHFLFAIDPAPVVQSALEFPFSPAPLVLRLRPRPISSTAATATQPTSPSTPDRLQGQQEGLDPDPGSISTANISTSATPEVLR